MGEGLAHRGGGVIRARPGARFCLDGAWVGEYGLASQEGRTMAMGRLWVFALVLGLAGSPAAAATFAVDSTVDAVDAAPGDGVCASAGGSCTLRAAIQEANALAGPDEV